MRAIIYVEGHSDRITLERLLAPLIEIKLQEGVLIQFIPADGKAGLLKRAPARAVDILRNDPGSVVAAMPDLFPRNVTFPHETAEELCAGLRQAFLDTMQRKHVEDERLIDRFRAFCLKYDLEALVLAAEQGLGARIGSSNLSPTWRLPVEDQDHDNPPRKVVEALFQSKGQHYVSIADAPIILAGADYREIADRCPQCFKPFVEFLEGLA